MTEAVQGQVAIPRGGSALLALLDDGDADGALRINAELAKEMPFAEVVERWCVGQIRVGAPEGWAEGAQRVWAKAKAEADPALREVAEGAMAEWAADRVALAGKERLAGLGARLEAAKLKIDEAVEAEEAEKAAVVWSVSTFVETPVLSRRAQLDNAKAFTRDKLTFYAEGKQSGPGTYFFDQNWWQWNGAFYERAPEQRVTDMVCEYLDKAMSKSGEEGLVRFRPTTRDVTALMTFLRSNVGLDDRAAPPRWLDERASPSAVSLLSFRNCLVDVTTGKTYAHEPWLWMHDGVDFNYDPKARCPHWEQFLRELFPKDDEAREMIEEELGYGMTIDNQFEKAALWVGPPRSGRGTLARIQELLVGPNGYTSLNIHTWHNNENSRQGLVGKRVGIFHDMRLKPPKQYGNVSYDAGGIDPQSQQLLLEYISGDLTEIGRKYLEAWKGEPFAKFRLISNKVPNFNDEVLVTRFNIIEFTESFLGRENPALKRRLLPAELPGIANRCLAAYRRLLERGKFVQPKSGLALLQKVRAAVSPWAVFIDCWEPDPQGEGTLVSDFDDAFRQWCLQTGTPETQELAGTSNSTNIIQNIKKLPGWHWLKSRRSGSDPRRYGVKLKAGAKLSGAPPTPPCSKEKGG